MTNFYTYQYFTRQPNRTSTIILIVNVALLLAFILFLFLFLRHRDDGKYRELTIIAILGLLLTLTIQYDNWNQDRNNLSGNGQVANLIKQVSNSQKVKTKDITSNSTNLQDGMILKVKNKYFEVTLNADNSSYQLNQTHLMNPKINIINQ